jgi:hypothetical protein
MHDRALLMLISFLSRVGSASNAPTSLSRYVFDTKVFVKTGAASLVVELSICGLEHAFSA